MYDVQTGQATQIAKHDGPIRVCKYVDTPSGGIVVTGSWDKTIKVRDDHAIQYQHTLTWQQYWDIRSQNPVSSVTLPERCYSLDVAHPLMVVGTAERHIQIFNLTNPTTVYKARDGDFESFSNLSNNDMHQNMVSPLKWQTRVVSCFPSSNGFAIGTIEGRVAIQ